MFKNGEKLPKRSRRERLDDPTCLLAVFDGLDGGELELSRECVWL